MPSTILRMITLNLLCLIMVKKKQLPKILKNKLRQILLSRILSYMITYLSKSYLRKLRELSATLSVTSQIILKRRHVLNKNKNKFRWILLELIK